MDVFDIYPSYPPIFFKSHICKEQTGKVYFFAFLRKIPQMNFLRLRSNGKMGFMQYGCIYPSFFSYTLGNIFLISYKTSRICKEQTGKVFFASLRKIYTNELEVKVLSLSGFSCVREASFKRKNVIKKKSYPRGSLLVSTK